MTKLENIYRKLNPDNTAALWLVVWWLFNIVTAALSQLADDEAYYHIYAQTLDWGYFDHPPVTALTVWLGQRLFNGELGVRFCFTIMQPLYLFIFWRLIKPDNATQRDAELYTMICAAMLVLQLYGFIAVPDAPLLLSSVLFLAAFKNFTREQKYSWLWLGAALGFMAYCKYHGALVLLFALAANVRWFAEQPKRIARLAAAGAVAVAMLTPHLLWQHDHGWASFVYHLSGRNGVFRLSNITDFLFNMAVVFSPFYVPLWVQAYRKVKPATPTERALWAFPPAFVLFFTATAFRGYVQPQWAIVAVLGLVWILFGYARRHPRTRRYVMITGAVTLVLVALTRIEMIFNPLGIRYQIFDNRESYAEIAAAADGRPVLFNCGYTPASKYAFYASTDLVYGQPNVNMPDELHPKANYRSSQWQFRHDDRRFTGMEILAEVDSRRFAGNPAMQTLRLKNGRDFHYIVVKDFRPVREVAIESAGTLPREVHHGDRLNFTLRITNPYPYDIDVDGIHHRLEIIWAHRTPTSALYPLTEGFTVPSGGSIGIGCSFTIPDDLPPQRYTVGFAVRHRDLYTWFGSPTVEVEVIE